MAFLISCVKTEPGIITDNKNHLNTSDKYNTSSKFKLSLQKKYGGKQKDTLLAESIGNYTKFLARTDYMIGIMKTSVPHMDIKSTDLIVAEKDKCGFKYLRDPKQLPHIISINGLSLDTFFSKETKSISINELFGSTVNLQIGKNKKFKQSTLDPNDPGEPDDPNIPAEIHIVSPDISQSGDGFPLCYYSDFILRWTGDQSNENGILIIIEWDGSMVFGEHYQNTSIRATDLYDDTGECTLNPHLFDDIPDTALCFLTIIRGNAEFMEVDDYGDLDDFEETEGTSYLFAAECSETIPFVLIRNIDII